MPEPEETASVGGDEGKGAGVSPGAGAVTAGSGEEAWGGGATIVGGERRLNRVKITLHEMPWENWHDIYNEVVQPLANEGAVIYCNVHLLVTWMAQDLLANLPHG